MNDKAFETFELATNVVLGGKKPVLIAGPCAVESEAQTLETAEQARRIAEKLGFAFVFKASFDKANRTSHLSFRSIGFDAALKILARVREKIQVPILTDIHETHQVKAVAKVVDVLQIPAFLCRQTDLLLAAGESGLPVNIKRGQFLAPEDMAHAVAKVCSTGNRKVFLTERGTSFGYHNLVVDMRSFPIMRKFAPVIFDCTHSVQIPGGMGTSTGGQREFIPTLSSAAAAAGVDGFFVETHPDPDKALSDGPNMIPLDQLEKFLAAPLVHWTARNQMGSESM